MRKIEAEFDSDWWFKVWGPEKLAEDGVGEAPTGCSGPTRAGTASASSRRLQHARPDQVHDHHAGPGRLGQLRQTGIPASIVTKFLAEHGVIVEKTGLYSFFIMFTIGITKGRWNTLLTRCSSSRTTTTRTRRCGASCPSSAPRSRATSAWACATCARRSTRCTQGRHRAA
jgi:arginine/lysine/ornithine decarboxylase